MQNVLATPAPSVSEDLMQLMQRAGTASIWDVLISMTPNARVAKHPLIVHLTAPDFQKMESHMRSLLVVAATLLLPMTHSFAAGAQCPEESGAKSVVSKQKTTITFGNKTAAPVKAYWIGFKGERKFYKDVAAAQKYKQSTYVGHPWIVTNAQLDCLGFYMPEAAGREVTVGP